MNYNWNFLRGTYFGDSGVAISEDLKYVVTFHNNLYVVVISTQELVPCLIALQAGLPLISTPTGCHVIRAANVNVDYYIKVIPRIADDDWDFRIPTLCFDCGNAEDEIEAMLIDDEQTLILEALKQ